VPPAGAPGGIRTHDGSLDRRIKSPQSSAARRQGRRLILPAELECSVQGSRCDDEMDGVTKRCCTCGQERPLSDFNRRASSEDGLQFRCRACSREWYERNKIAHVQNVVRRNRGFRVQLTALIGDYLLGHPCVDCGEADIRCLEFDHRDRSTKKDNVARMMASALPWHFILEEIAKCDVRCANCHRRRTTEQFNSWRHRFFLAQGDRTVPPDA
jgi:hypothetical protein